MNYLNMNLERPEVCNGSFNSNAAWWRFDNTRSVNCIVLEKDKKLMVSLVAMTCNFMYIEMQDNMQYIIILCFMWFLKLSHQYIEYIKKHIIKIIKVYSFRRAWKMVLKWFGDIIVTTKNAAAKYYPDKDKCQK